MARNTAMTVDDQIENETVTIEIYHADFGADATADVRCFGLDELTQDVFDEHYESLGEPVEIDSGVLDAGEPVLAIEILEDVWKRTQGGRTDAELPYDGSQVRSSCVGDVVVLDGVPFAAADVGFERVELDVGQDDPKLVTDGGVDLPPANDVDLWDVEEGDEIHLPGGTVLEIVEAIHHSRDFGDDSHRFRARKPSGHVVRLESHNLETAFASGGELVKPPTQNPDAIPVDEFYYGDSPRWFAVRHRIEYVRRNQYGRDIFGEKVGQSVVAVDPDDAAV